MISKILLINPTDYGGQPLGLAYLASVLEKEGYKVEILDMPTLKTSLKEVYYYLKGQSPDIVGVGSLTPNMPTTYEICKFAKSLGIITVVGGPHITTLPYRTMKECKQIDVSVLGEGELTTLELVTTIDKHGFLDSRDLNRIKGIVYRDQNNNVRTTEPRPFIKNLDDLPFPARHLLSMDNVSHALIIASRGCPFNCGFCTVHDIFGRSIRYRTVENVLSEMETIKQDFGITRFHFPDTFTVSRKFVHKFCREITKRGLSVQWTCSTRVDTISRNMVKEMKDAGCNKLLFGVESGSDEILSYANKGFNTEQIRRGFSIAQEVGIKTHAFLMIGFPYEKKEQVKRSIEFVKKLKPDDFEVSVLVPFPGTVIYKELKEKNLLTTEDWKTYDYKSMDCIDIIKREFLQKDDILKLFMRMNVEIGKSLFLDSLLHCKFRVSLAYHCLRNAMNYIRRS